MKKTLITSLLLVSMLSGLLCASELIQQENNAGRESNQGKNNTKETIYDIWVDLKNIRYYSGGLKTFYVHLKKLIDYSALVKLIGQPVFLSGPHQEGKLDLKSYTSFGHYNKVAVIWMREHLIPAAEDEEFREFTQDTYDTYLSKLARTYYAALIALHNDEEFNEKALKDYMEHISKGRYFAYSKYYDFVNQKLGPKLKKKYHFDGNLASQAVAFWLRRHMDGTSDEFEKGLRKLLTTYDHDFLLTLDSPF